MLIRQALSVAAISLCSAVGTAQSLFIYGFGDPVVRDSMLTATASGPGQVISSTDSDSGTTPINGSSTYLTGVDDGATAQGGGSACGQSTVNWNVDVEGESQLSVLPRARFIQFNGISEGSSYSDRVSTGQCSMQVKSRVTTDQSLSIPFTLTAAATVRTTSLRLDRRSDTFSFTGNVPIFSVSSKLSWVLHEDTNGNGLVDPGEPVADNGMAQQSIVAFIDQLVDISGSYTAALAAGSYVLSCTYEGDEQTLGGFQGNPTLFSDWQFDHSVPSSFRLEIL